MKWTISQNVAERPHNITSILNIFKSFIKKVYQKKICTQKFREKKDQKVYFASEISRRKEKLLTLKQKKQIDF